MEKRQIESFNIIASKLPEGVDRNKYISLASITNNAEEVEALFKQYGYDLSNISGAFVKIYTLDKKEIKELEAVLNRIDELGLQNAFQINLGLGYFTKSFIEKIEYAFNNHMPFQNPDGSFIRVFEAYKEVGTNEEEQAKDRDLAQHEVVMVPAEQLKSTEEIQNSEYSNADPRQGMTDEQRQVYNTIVEKLSYLRMENMKDERIEMIDQVIRNIIRNLGPAILRKEHEFLGINDMIKNIMFEGLDVNPVANLQMEELIDGVFPPENTVGRLA